MFVCLKETRIPSHETIITLVKDDDNKNEFDGIVS